MAFTSSVQLQQLLSQPRALLIFGLSALFLLIFEFEHTGTTKPGSAFVDAVTENNTQASALQGKLAETFNSTLGFEKVFVVSLPERSDHRDTVTLTSTLTGFEVEFIDGWHYDKIPEKAMPPKAGIAENGARGAWRGHMDAMRRIVAEGIGSALIAEEDFDWDIRLKEQLRDFAVASSGLLSQYPTEHIPHFAKAAGEFIDYSELASWLYANQNKVRTPHSPYGDGWDVLWLGNCGISMTPRREDWQTLPIVRHNDSTVAPVKDYFNWDWANPVPHPYLSYPDGTRLYLSQPSDGVCSIAYAVSQRGARKILLELGMERADKAYDLMLQDFCQGGWDGGEPHACWGVLPSLFDSYKSAGPESKDSDIATGLTDVRSQGFTRNIQRSVRVNARKMLADPWEEIVDQYPYEHWTT